MKRAGHLLCLDPVFSKVVNDHGKIKKAVSPSDQSKIDSKVPLLPRDCEMQICGPLRGGSAIVQGIKKEVIDKNR